MAVAAEGFETVVNLATIKRRYSLPDEEGLVRSLGLDYVHLPVDFAQPKRDDYQAFCEVMDSLTGKKVLLHCAANYRVTAFYSFYAMAKLGWTIQEADDFIASIWKPSEFNPWQSFIEEIRVAISSG